MGAGTALTLCLTNTRRRIVRLRAVMPRQRRAEQESELDRVAHEQDQGGRMFRHMKCGVYASEPAANNDQDPA
jgi:hypothetical protein